jgi:hypothetical protein
MKEFSLEAKVLPVVTSVPIIQEEVVKNTFQKVTIVQGPDCKRKKLTARWWVEKLRKIGRDNAGQCHFL